MQMENDSTKLITGKIEQLEGVRISAWPHAFDYTASYQVAAHNRHLRTDV